MKAVFVLSGVLLFAVLTSFSHVKSSEYEIDGIYKGLVPDDGVKVLAQNDQLEEAKLILAPISIDRGKYQVKVTRKGLNLYKVDDRNIYIHTKFCFEYKSNEEVMLNITSGTGEVMGKIAF